MKFASIFLGLVIFVLPPLQAQEPPPGDGLSRGLWWLYHLKYEKAHQIFNQYCQEHPKDPSGYFYKTATDWWQLAQQFDFDLPEIEKRLEVDFEQTVAAAEDLMDSAADDKTRALAQLYWGGAEGLKGRWLVTQKQWIRAYFMGKSGAHRLRRAVQYDPTLYDAYMGLGIYDYFTDTLPGVQGVLAALFIHGDKKRGLQELQWAIDKSSHARVEAMFFLVEIYTAEEHTPEKALPITHALRREFPASPAMHLAEVMTLFTMKDWDTMTVEAQSFLEKSEQEVPWFTREGVRPALYCLGAAALWNRHDSEACLRRMNHILNMGIDSSRWVSFAYLRRGQAYDLKGEREKALEDYHRVLDRADFWGSHQEARRYVKKPFSW